MCTSTVLWRRPKSMPVAVVSTKSGSSSTFTSKPSLTRLLRSCSLPKPALWQDHKRLSRRANKSRSCDYIAASQQDSAEAARPIQSSLSAPECPPAYRIRSVRPEEADQIAALNATVSCMRCLLVLSCSASVTNTVVTSPNRKCHVA